MNTASNSSVERRMVNGEASMSIHYYECSSVHLSHHLTRLSTFLTRIFWECNVILTIDF